MLGSGLAVLGFTSPDTAAAATAGQLLNVSFDISRELFVELNAAFVAAWEAKTGQQVRIQQSHGGSSRQARAVIDGLRADVVTLNQAIDLDALASRGVIEANWRELWPHQSTPYGSTIVFLVRRGNPKVIRDWEDLIQPGVSMVVPNPKTSGNGRYSYLAAYAYARQYLKRDEAGARDFVQSIFARVPVMDTGGRGATTTFIERGIGDVLLTFEAEVFLAFRELGENVAVEVVRPSLSIQADMPVALVPRVLRRNGSEVLARGYLDFLYSEAGQEIVARQGFRPRHPEVLKRHSDRFGGITLFQPEDTFGPWADIQAAHFAEGGQFDQIMRKLNQR